MKMPPRFVAWAFAGLLAACGRDSGTTSPVAAPGAPEGAKTQALEAGAAVLQQKPPLAALNAYLDGFHFYSGRPQAQMEAHHYCGHVNEDVIQCVIFDGSVQDAKIMGVEYIVSAKLFAGLPPAEKALWHSHVHEVKSGQLVAPGIPAVAEKELMEKLVGTYGKTWHTWHTDAGLALPLGVPQLMMGFTADGQVDAAMVAARDQRLGVSSARGASSARTSRPRRWTLARMRGSAGRHTRLRIRRGKCTRTGPVRHRLHRHGVRERCCDPGSATQGTPWIPAFAGMTTLRRMRARVRDDALSRDRAAASGRSPARPRPRRRRPCG